MVKESRICLIVDLANVMGSRPDGWWRDRAGAATRWLAQLEPLVHRRVTLPDGGPGTLSEVVVVLEGQARAAGAGPSTPLRVVRAERDGDSTVVAVAETALTLVDATAAAGGTDAGGMDAVGTDAGGAEPGGSGSGGVPLVVTADRGLRARLPLGVGFVGPGWLLGLVD
jgi:hypothetical protein